MVIVAETPCIVKVHTAVLPDLLQTAVDTLYADARRTSVYTDFFPATGDDWIRAVLNGLFLPFVWTVNGEFGGLYWFHDQGFADIFPFAWVGLYVAKPWRRLPTLGGQAWRQVEAIMAQRGVTRIFGASRSTNLAVKRFAEVYMRFHCLGLYQDWAWFNGRLEASLMYTRHLADQSLLWVSAEQRAAQARRCRIVSEKS